MCICIAAVICAAAAAVVFMITDINRRFPEPDVLTYTKDNPAIENGVEMTPLECHVYTQEEYDSIYAGSSIYSDGSYDSDRFRIIEFKVRYKNVSNEECTYRTDLYMMVGGTSGAYNGALEKSGKSVSVIEPGEVQEHTMTASVLAPSIIKKKYISTLKDETFYLVYWWYPSTKRLEFSTAND